MTETTDSPKRGKAEAKLAGIRRTLAAVREAYAEARREGATKAELAPIESLGVELAYREERGDEYVQSLRDEGGDQ